MTKRHAFLMPVGKPSTTGMKGLEANENKESLDVVGFGDFCYAFPNVENHLHEAVFCRVGRARVAARQHRVVGRGG